MKPINCIILDDEPFAVKLLADYASKVPQLNVLYAGCDVFKAMEVLNSEMVDLIFIDIQMPQLTGIEFMQLFNQNHNFVITSAYSKYALDGYQFRVIDFLLKPITFGKFYQSIEKYNHWRETFHIPKTDDFLFVKADRKHYKISINSIRYIEGLKDYIRIHTDVEKIMVLDTMKNILNTLPKHKFVRIHRSYIIPFEKIKIIEGNRIQLINDTFLPIGETYRKLISNWVNRSK